MGRFNNATKGLTLNGTGVQGNSYFFLFQTEFNSCASAFWPGNVNRVTLSGCTFDGDVVGGEAIVGFQVGQIQLNGSTVQNYAFGAYLTNVNLFRTSGTTIQNTGSAIEAPCLEGGDLNKSNVSLYNTTITNCTSAIHIGKGGVDANGVDYGLVDMKCSKLISNGIGISGVDILLEIDGCSGNDPSNTYCKPNSFIQFPTGGDYFDIAYVDRDDIDTVLATHNYWSPMPVNSGSPNVINYSLRKALSYNSNGCVASDFNNDVTLDYSDYLVDEPSGCGSGPPNPQPGPHVEVTEFTGTPYECGINTPGGQYQLDQQYHSATWFFNQDSMEVAYLQYEALAALPNKIRDTSDQICRHYIDVARVMAYALSSEGSANTNAGGWVEGAFRPTNLDSGELRLKVRPNPATESVQIELGAAPFQLRVYDLLGNMVNAYTMSSGESITVTDWSPGVYLLRAIEETTGEQQAVKLVKQ